MRSALGLLLAASLGACADAPPTPPSSHRTMPTLASSVTILPPTAPPATPTSSAPIAIEPPPTPPSVEPPPNPDADRAVSAVLKLPGVQGMCSEAIARGAASCSAWLAQPSNGPCKNQRVAYENEDCWWT